MRISSSFEGCVDDLPGDAPAAMGVRFRLSLSRALVSPLSLSLARSLSLALCPPLSSVHGETHPRLNTIALAYLEHIRAVLGDVLLCCFKAAARARWPVSFLR